MLIENRSVSLFEAMNQLGLPTQFDPNDGTSAGPAFVPTDIDPQNQTRSDARRTYFDPYVHRSNFHVITNQHVTRILIEGVANNSQVSNPSTGGNDSGNGPSDGDNEGFGFGPGGSTPPIEGQTAPGIAKRQDPASSNLRIQGVEVSQLNYYREVSMLTLPVCTKCYRASSSRVRHSRSHCCCWCSSLGPTFPAIRHRAFFRA